MEQMMDLLDSKLEREILTTRAVNKHKRKTPQSIRDYEKIKQRITDVGIKMDIVSAYLDHLFGSHVTALSLLKNANHYAKKIGIQVDRLAKRNRSAMLCWYAENWDKIKPYLPYKQDVQLISIEPSIYSQTYPQQTIIEYDVSDIRQLLNYH